MIYLWPIDEIIDYSTGGYHDVENLGLPIGDFFIGAEIIVSRFSEEHCHVFNLELHEKLADSPMEFLEGLLAGRYDLPG